MGMPDESTTTSTATMVQQQQEPLFLGIDLSTQSITAVVVEGGSHQVVASASLNFEQELPKYATTSGMHVGKAGKITSPVMMWLEGLDKVLRRLDRAVLARVRVVSGSAQQHGSVYWNAEGLQALRGMKPEDSLTVNLYDGFALEDCPIWADSSTQAECDAIEAAVGGPGAVAAITGSRCYARFTGPQIKKIARTQPLVWHHTARVSLVSSFLTSLLLGRPAPIDASDASGMNLMNLFTGEWSEDLLQATAPGLRNRLGATLTHPWEVQGFISPYFAARYGLPQDCLVVPATGDNNCSLVGMGLSPPADDQQQGQQGQNAAAAVAGVLMVSLGTSDTLVGLTRRPRPGAEGHVMLSPRGPDEYFAMLCFKNGAVAREAVRDAVAGGSWTAFSNLLRQAPPGNDGKLALTLALEEIIPVLPVKGVIFRADGGNEGPADLLPSGQAFDAAHEARAVVEARFLSMKAHAAAIGLPTRPARILATGGGSTNQEIMQILADVFDCEVLVADSSESAALGAALRAEHGLACRKSASRSHWVPFEATEPQCLKQVAAPQHASVYKGETLARYAAFERAVVLAATSGNERKV